MPYAATMQALFDSSWRAGAYCLPPRVISWTLLQLLLAVAPLGLMAVALLLLVVSLPLWLIPPLALLPPSLMPLP